jgi:hypothetical protein
MAHKKMACQETWRWDEMCRYYRQDRPCRWEQIRQASYFGGSTERVYGYAYPALTLASSHIYYHGFSIALFNCVATSAS